MKRFTERYRPRLLSAIVGQTAVKVLTRFVAAPYAACWLLEGPPGIGKTSAALALAAELGALDEMSGLRVVCASELSTEQARETMMRLRLLPMCGTWQVVVLEELERLHHQAQTYLKVALERDLPDHAVIVATSNDSSGLQPALRQRFVSLGLVADRRLADAARTHLADIWRREAGDLELPAWWTNWGWSKGSLGGEFSMRVAIDALQLELLSREAVEV